MRARLRAAALVLLAGTAVGAAGAAVAAAPAAAGLAPAAAAPATQADRCDRPSRQAHEGGDACADRVLVVGVPGLRWDDVGPATPALQSLIDRGARGVLSVKAVPAVTCPADGWLTLGAGNRAVAVGIERDPCSGEVPPPGDAQVAANRDLREGAQLGALAAALDGCVDLQGAGPLLAVGRPSMRGRDMGCPLVLREAPAVAGTGTERTESVVEADRALARLLRALPVDAVLVVGLSAAPGERDRSLHVAVAAGAGFDPGALRSASTRRAPYVQLVDVAPTVLELLGREPAASMTGEPWRVRGAPPTPAELADLAAKARAQESVTVPFFVVLLASQLLLVLVALWRRRPELAELVALGGVAALGASYAANLLPWWRSPAPLLTLLAVVAVVSTVVVGLAVQARGLLVPVGIACAFPAGVLVVDLLTGAHLQMSSVAGYSPLVAGRFAGIGNVAFGVLAAAALLATAALTRRAAVVAVVGAVVVVVDGAPPWGSDVGGVLALVPAFALLALLMSGRRASLPRLLLAAAAGVLVVTVFALADWSRAPADRTHLGRFVQDLADGTAGALLARKADAVLSLLLANAATALLPLVVVAAAYLVARPPGPLARAFEAAPRWRSGLLATGLAAGIGFAVNDSGAAVPALALVVAVPATAAVVLRARRAPVGPPAL